MNSNKMTSGFLVVLFELTGRRVLTFAAQLLKQSRVNRLKVEHYRTLMISRGFYDLLLKLNRRRLLVHGARLQHRAEQAGKTRAPRDSGIMTSGFLVMMSELIGRKVLA